MKTVKNLLKIDFFAKKPELYFNKKSEMKTRLGIVASYIVLVLSTFYLGYLIHDMIQKEKPSLVISDKLFTTKDDSYFVEIGGKDRSIFPLCFGLVRRFKPIPYDKTFFNITAFMYTFKRQKTFGEFDLETRKVGIRPCKADDFSQSEFREVLSDSDFQPENYLCFEQNEASPPRFGGLIGAQIYSQLNIYIKKCENTTDVICKPKDIIDEELKLIQFGGSFVNKYFNIKNYDSSTERSLYWFYSQLIPDLAKNIDLNFQKLTLETDIGYLASETKTESYLNLVSETEKLALESAVTSEKYLITYTIKLDRVEKIYSRKYIKIQDLFANLGGLVKIILLVAQILLHPFVDQRYRELLLNSIFPLKRTCSKQTLKDEKGAKPKKKKRYCFSLLISFFKRLFDKKSNLIIYKNLGIRNICKRMAEQELLLKIMFPKKERELFGSLVKQKFSDIYEKKRSSISLSEPKAEQISSRSIKKSNLRNHLSSLIKYHAQVKSDDLADAMSDKKLSQVENGEKSASKKENGDKSSSYKENLDKVVIEIVNYPTTPLPDQNGIVHKFPEREN